MTMTASSTPNLAISLVTLLFIASFVFLAIDQLQPPDAASTSTPLTEFSSGRAMEHLKIIARRAHPTGSFENARVRDYIVTQLTALGLRPQVQEVTAANPLLVRKFPGSPIPAATVQNIVGRLIGTEHTKAVMLVGHYDSVPTAPGASDDGAAVAMMLETLRALRASSPLRNDVVFLFTDGEELGLLGAEAFVDEHPWVKDVGIVLNFEARGNRGPVFMFETSEQNGWLIGEFAHAAPNPVANSLMYSLYRSLPNDTDLTVFKWAGLTGLNFAYAQGLNHYHTLLDNVEEIDERSLQHHGSYALPLTRHFGNLSLGTIRKRDAVYFTAFGTLVHYSEAWVLPLTLLVTAFFVGIVVLGIRTRQLNLIGIGWGALALMASAVTAVAVVTLTWWTTRRLLPEYRSIPAEDPYHSYLYLLGFVCLTLAITSGGTAWLRQKTSVANLMVGGAFWWLALLVAISLVLPGGSYLLLWPLLSSLAATGFMLVTREQEPVSWKHLVVLLLCAIPGIILLTQIFYMLFIMMSLQIAGGLMAVIVLLLGLLIPQLNLISRPSKRWLPAASILTGLALIMAGGLTSGFDARHRKANDIFYVLNADSGKAVWASFDRAPDEWTSQFLTGNVKRTAMTELFPWITQEALQSPAPFAPLAEPNLEVVDENTQDGIRTVRVRMLSLRQARTVYIYADPQAEVLGAVVNGRRVAGTGMLTQVQAKKPWRLRYTAVPQEGLELIIETRSSQSLKLRVIDVSHTLPEIPGLAFKRRPDYMMPSPYRDASDTTLVAKSFDF
jgi:Peptidase family M28